MTSRWLVISYRWFEELASSIFGVTKKMVAENTSKTSEVTDYHGFVSQKTYFIHKRREYLIKVVFFVGCVSAN
jgi:hypothetical protein